jgi:hypothetical protein
MTGSVVSRKSSDFSAVMVVEITLANRKAESGNIIYCMAAPVFVCVNDKFT